MFSINCLKGLLPAVFTALATTHMTSVASESLCDFSTINIVTGEPGTTYYEMGTEVADLLSENQMRARVHPLSLIHI